MYSQDVLVLNSDLILLNPWLNFSSGSPQNGGMRQRFKSLRLFWATGTKIFPVAVLGKVSEVSIFLFPIVILRVEGGRPSKCDFSHRRLPNRPLLSVHVFLVGRLLSGAQLRPECRLSWNDSACLAIWNKYYLFCLCVTTLYTLSLLENDYGQIFVTENKKAFYYINKYYVNKKVDSKKQ